MLRCTHIMHTHIHTMHIMHTYIHEYVCMCMCMHTPLEWQTTVIQGVSRHRFEVSIQNCVAGGGCDSRLETSAKRHGLLLYLNQCGRIKYHIELGF